MLFFLRVLAGGQQQEVAVDLVPSNTVLQLKKQLYSKVPDIAVSNILFAGKVLLDDQTIESYDIQKECTVQVIARKIEPARKLAADEKKGDAKAVASPAADAELALRLAKMGPVALVTRQQTNPLIQFGDVLVVELLCAKSLKSADFFTGSSDAYAILVLNRAMARSSIVYKSLNPVWNETFGFLLDPDTTPDDTYLSLLLFDHDYLTPDDPLGNAQIQLSSIPRDQTFEKTYKLDGVNTGEVTVRFRRSALTSAELRRKLQSLAKAEKPWKAPDLAKHGVTVDHFVGNKPFTVPVTDLDPLAKPVKVRKPSVSGGGGGGGDEFVVVDRENPALTHLEKLIRTKALVLTNERTTAKVANILYSQSHTFTGDVPTRYLWMTDITLSEAAFLAVCNSLSEGMVKACRFIVHPPPPGTLAAVAMAGGVGTTAGATKFSFFPATSTVSAPAAPASPVTPNSTGSGGGGGGFSGYGSFLASAVVTFRSCESALMVLLALQKKAVDGAERPIKVGFAEKYVYDAAVAVAVAGAAPTPLASAAPSKPDLKVSASKDGIDSKSAVSVPAAGGGAGAGAGAGVRPVDHAFISSVRSGVLEISGPHPANVELKAGGHHYTEWRHHLIVLTGGDGEQLSAFLKFQSAGAGAGAGGPVPTFRLELSDCLILATGPWSLQLLEKKKQLAYYLRAKSVEELNGWKASFNQARLRRRSASVSNHPALAPPSLADSKSSSGGDEKALVDKLINKYKRVVLTCSLCKHEKPLADVYWLDSADSRTQPAACMKCLTDRVLGVTAAASPPPAAAPVVAADEKKTPMSAAGAALAATKPRAGSSISIGVDGSKAASAIMSEYSLQDLRDLNAMQAFTTFIEIQTQTFIESQTRSVAAAGGALTSKFVACPKCSVPFELEIHSWATKKSALLVAAMGLDNRPLNSAAQNHFLTNRFRCRNEKCSASFCRLCAKVPYHIGFTCGEYKEYLASPKCRYCSVAVMKGRNQMKNPPFPSFTDVCDLPACAEKAASACGKQHAGCNHPCGGLVGEAACLPCLYPECLEKSAEKHKPTQDKNDLCNICYTDELGTTPCARLECGHVFHAPCLKTRIETKWPGARIGWKFLECPLCNAEMKHPFVHDLQLKTGVALLRQKVVEKAMARAELEKLADDKHVKDKNSPFFGNVLKYALSSYAYFRCKLCSEPYFGGKRDCEQNAAEEKVNPDELVCFTCANAKNELIECNKPEHAEFIVYKCRYCCSGAIWHCFGTTHFCDYCHSNWPPNRHPKNEKCPGPDGKCPLGLVVGTHSNGDDVKHEKALYCGACREEKLKITGNKSNVPESAAQKKIREEEEAMEKKLSAKRAEEKKKADQEKKAADEAKKKEEDEKKKIEDDKKKEADKKKKEDDKRDADKRKKEAEEKKKKDADAKKQKEEEEFLAKAVEDIKKLEAKAEADELAKEIAAIAKMEKEAEEKERRRGLNPLMSDLANQSAGALAHQIARVATGVPEAPPLVSEMIAVPIPVGAGGLPAPDAPLPPMLVEPPKPNH